MLQTSHSKRHARERRPLRTWGRLLARRVAWRLFIVLGVLGVVGTLAGDTDAAPLRVRVRGSAKLAARASRDQIVAQTGASELVLSGSLTDDAGQPLPLQPV